MSVFFNGRLLVTPTTASAVNDSALNPQSASVGNIVALAGRAAGGQPKTALRYGSPQEAERDLVSGELLDAVKAAFDPSPETGGPQTVVAVRVDDALQSTGVLRDAENAPAITLTSINYGARENTIQYKVEPGSFSGLRITTKRGTDYYTKDNVERKAFSLRYTGTEATADVTVTATSVVVSAPTGTALATIDLSQFKTILDLVDRLNMVSDIEATVLDSSANARAFNGLDFVTSQDITSEYVVKGDLQAVIDWINGPSQGFVRAERALGAGKPPTAYDWAFMTGGTDGLTTFNDWAAAAEVLQTVDVQWLTPVSGDPAVHALFDTHVMYMSTVVGRERRAICGSELNTTDLQAIDAAKQLLSPRTSLVHLGHYNYDQAGQLTLYPAYITAALISGAFSGVNPGTPLTNKAVKVRGLERYLRNPTDTDPLILGGVFAIEKTDDGLYKVVKSITTWTTDQNFNKVEQSTGAALDFVCRRVRKTLDQLRGGKGGPVNLARAASVVDTELRELAKPEPQGPEIIVGDAQNPAFKNISVSLVNDVLGAQFECSPVIPINYATVSVFAVPYSGTASA